MDQNKSPEELILLDLMASHVEFGFAADVQRSGPDTAEWGGRRHPTIEVIPDPSRIQSDRLLMNGIAKLVAGRRFLLLQMENELEKTKALRLEILRSIED